MKIVFRVNYHTVPGESLWVRLSIQPEGTNVRIEQVLPLAWLNDRQWQAQHVVRASCRLRLEYSYQFRDARNGVELDEWDGPRVAVADPVAHEVLLLEDDWRSAGVVDYAFETKAFEAVHAARGPFAEPLVPDGANHTLRLRMAAVPDGLVPCVIGSVREIGDWGWHHALPMREVAANLWQTDLHLPADWRIEYKYGLFNPKLGCAVNLENGDNRVLEARALAERQWTVVHDEGYRRGPEMLYRAAGVAVPVFSLRGEQSLGVGEFADLKPLADWAAGVGLKLIQILPVNDTASAHDWTDSYPYSAISVFALHPLYLRIEDMGHAMPAAFAEELDAAREWLNAMEHVDYEEVMKAKTNLCRKVFKKHRKSITTGKGFREFMEENRGWLPAYAAFCVMRDHFHTADFSRWGDWAVFDRARVEAMMDPGHPEWPEISYHVWLQYELDRQLADAAAHLHQRGVALKGDLPIGIDRHSADAWSAPHLFHMDEQAGAPPDAFSMKGQNWGFPTYNWEVMRQDDYAWWRARFEHLSHFFDAYRIDHILGFFRIWQIPVDQVEGIMGWFEPALPVRLEEFSERRIQFDYERFCRPYIPGRVLWERFGEAADEIVHHYLEPSGKDVYQLRGFVSNQRRIVEHFATWDVSDPAVRDRMERMRRGLLDCASEVLFFEVPGSHGTEFHPRCLLQTTASFEDLDEDDKRRVDELYIDYFHRRQEPFWQARGYEVLPAMRRASSMLLCGEDLGMVPHCVPGVMRELGILSLEIQRMPKTSHEEFSDPARAPYLSVVSPSTHDMSGLRGWWRESPQVTSRFAWQQLGIAFPPAELSGELATRILHLHLQSPAMWAVFPIQDLLAIDEDLRLPDPDAERINIPAVMPHYWRYRMHLMLEELAAADGFNDKLARLLKASGRSGANDGR